MVHSKKTNRTTIHYTNPLAIREISNSMIHYLPEDTSDIIILCIGTDRSTGDSLGPLTGSYLTKMNISHLHTFGSLHEPIHAVNLEKTIDTINQTFTKPFIIAVDASLGNSKLIGHLVCAKGSLKPGAALKKELPPVGNIYVTGIVNLCGFMEFSVLQSTRLSIVSDMATIIAQSLWRVNFHLKQHINQKKALRYL